MKVYEIISEERIDEGLGVGSSIKKGVGKIANWLVPTADEMSLKNATGKGWLANISKVIPNSAIITVLTKPILTYYSAIEAAEKAVEMGDERCTVQAYSLFALSVSNYQDKKKTQSNAGPTQPHRPSCD